MAVAEGIDVESVWRRSAAVSIIALVLLLNYTDRLVLGILVEPIRREFGLNDGEIGLLTGPAFALVYAILVIPIARLAERQSRVKIIAICLALWSVATVACGLAGGLITLMLARMAVGAGEAGGIAPSMSLVSDLFPARQRSTAMSIFGLGASAGVLFAPLIGGALLALAGWRTTFVSLGLIGLPIALLIFFGVREPQRGRMDGVQAATGVGFVPALTRLLRRPSYSLLLLAIVLSTLAQVSMLLWLPAFFERTYGISGAELGVKLSLHQGLPLLAGNVLGGFIGDWLSRRDERWLAWMPMSAWLVAVPVTALMFAVHNETVAFALLALPSFFQGLGTGPSYALVQNLAAVHSRATSTAVVAFFVTIFGAALGPLLLGVLSQFLSARFGFESLRYAFFAVCPICALAAASYFAMSGRLRHDLEDARQDSARAAA